MELGPADPRSVGGAVDTDPITSWSIWPLVGRSRQAVFQPARPIGPLAGLRLRVDLVSGIERDPQHTLGRFRLSVTNRPFPFFESSLLRIKTKSERNGLTRLGAAYSLLGAWARAVASGRAAARARTAAAEAQSPSR